MGMAGEQAPATTGICGAGTPAAMWIALLDGPVQRGTGGSARIKDATASTKETVAYV